MTDSSESLDREPSLGSYVVITPVRNEERHIGETIDSMAVQTVLPAEWVIVDDGSTDGTPEILKEASRNLPWLRVVTRPDRGFRLSGRGVVDAFYEGYSQLRVEWWDFLVKLDGDLTFPDDYFERCLERFLQEADLGITGGTIESVDKGGTRGESHPAFHVRGATKMYRRRVWEEIGGLISAPGWDGLDEIKANMLGWRTRTLPDLILKQLKPTGSADGQWRNWLKAGEACYAIGYHPVFVLARSMSRATRSPYLIASAGLIVGYLRASMSGSRRAADPAMIAYVRQQQIARLLGRETIWR